VDDDHEWERFLAFIDMIAEAGCRMFVVHARNAWLQGLSPKENREIPPLDYQRVYRLKERLPNRFIGINGGIQKPDEVSTHLAHVDGVMLGRAAYHTPGLLPELEAAALGLPVNEMDLKDLLAGMKAYCERHIAEGGRLSHVTRHMVGLFAGLPGARRYRQILSVEAARPGASPDVLERAFAAVLESELPEAA
jgi:tRNA-dihydrouridine synthase A